MVILATLRHRATGREICVATTHLKARQGALLSTLRNEQVRPLPTLPFPTPDGGSYDPVREPLTLVSFGFVGPSVVTKEWT